MLLDQVDGGVDLLAVEGQVDLDTGRQLQVQERELAAADLIVSRLARHQGVGRGCSRECISVRRVQNVSVQERAWGAATSGARMAPGQGMMY
jgi:ribosomal protein L16/L10AE